MCGLFVPPKHLLFWKIGDGFWLLLLFHFLKHLLSRSHVLYLTFTRITVMYIHMGVGTKWKDHLSWDIFSVKTNFLIFSVNNFILVFFCKYLAPKISQDNSDPIFRAKRPVKVQKSGQTKNQFSSYWSGISSKFPWLAARRSPSDFWSTTSTPSRSRRSPSQFF